MTMTSTLDPGHSTQLSFPLRFFGNHTSQIYFFREMVILVFLHQPHMHNGVVQYIENREELNLEMCKGRLLGFDKMYNIFTPAGRFELNSHNANKFRFFVFFSDRYHRKITSDQ